jgi:DNA mismatch repair ATPase MutL
MPLDCREALHARPMTCQSALREVLENSIDAGASSITVCLLYNNGEQNEACGFVVEDDGHGIPSASMLHLLGTRYASSKPCFSSSSNSSSSSSSGSQLGYKGEALASICQLARLHVVSRAASSFETAEAVLGPAGQVHRRGLCSPHSLQHTAGGPGTRVMVVGYPAGTDHEPAAAPSSRQRR